LIIFTAILEIIKAQILSIGAERKLVLRLVIIIYYYKARNKVCNTTAPGERIPPPKQIGPESGV